MYGDGHFGYIRPQAHRSRVGDQLVFEAVSAIEIGIRNVNKGTVTVKGKLTMGNICNKPGGHDVHININVVKEHARSRNSQGFAFVGLVSVIYRLDLVFLIRDGDADGHNFAVSRAIIGFIGEGIGTVPIQSGGVFKSAVRLECQAAVANIPNQGRAQNVVIHVVSQNARCRNRQNSVFQCGVCISNCHRSNIIDNQGQAQSLKRVARQVRDRSIRCREDETASQVGDFIARVRGNDQDQTGFIYCDCAIRLPGKGNHSPIRHNDRLIDHNFGVIYRVALVNGDGRADCQYIIKSVRAKCSDCAKHWCNGIVDDQLKGHVFSMEDVAQGQDESGIGINFSSEHVCCDDTHQGCAAGIAPVAALQFVANDLPCVGCAIINDGSHSRAVLTIKCAKVASQVIHRTRSESGIVVSQRVDVGWIIKRPIANPGINRVIIVVRGRGDLSI